MTKWRSRSTVSLYLYYLHEVLTYTESQPVRSRSARAPSTPQGKPKARSPDAAFEKVGSGRGGFSVKGAASAAAKARWAKVRRERAERGEDWDDDRVRRRPGGATNRNRTAAAVETYERESITTPKASFDAFCM